MRGAHRRRAGDRQRRGGGARPAGRSRRRPGGGRRRAAPVAPGLVHYLLNKPAGVVTTAEDTHGRPTVCDLVPAEPRVHPVGRLDRDSEGLLVLTNDGDLTFRLTHPSFGVPKEYLVSVRGRAQPAGRAPAARRGGPRRRAAPPRPGWRWSAPASSASSSTRVATGRSAACARPSAIRSPDWCAPGSARWPTRTSPRARFRSLTTDEVRGPGRRGRRPSGSCRAGA